MNHRANLNVVEKETSMVPAGNTTQGNRSSISYLGECLCFFLSSVDLIPSLALWLAVTYTRHKK